MDGCGLDVVGMHRLSSAYVNQNKGSVDNYIDVSFLLFCKFICLYMIDLNNQQLENSAS